MDELELLRKKLDFLKQEITVLEECECKSVAEEAYKENFGDYPPIEYKYSKNNVWDFFKCGYDAAMKVRDCQDNVGENENVDPTIQERVNTFFENTAIPYEDDVIEKTLHVLITESLVDENGVALSGITDEIIDGLVDKIGNWIPTEHELSEEKATFFLLMKGYNAALSKIRSFLR